MKLSEEAAIYWHRRHSAIHELLETVKYDRGALCEFLSKPFVARSRDSLVVAFENTDADELVAGFLKYLPKGDAPLFCYWLDKKLISIPRFVLTAFAIEEYFERHAYEIDNLIIVRQTLDPEAVSAMIHRAIGRLMPIRISVVSLLATDEAEMRLLDMLPGPTGAKVEFRRFQSASYGDEVFHRMRITDGNDHPRFHTSPPFDDGPTIQQIDRKLFMPKLIQDRMRPRPEPGDDPIPPPYALQ